MPGAGFFFWTLGYFASNIINDKFNQLESITKYRLFQYLINYLPGVHKGAPRA